MSQNSSTSNSQQPESQQLHSADDTLYAIADCERVDLHNGGVLLIHRQNDKQMVVAREVSVALHSCRTFRTLQGHAELLATTIPQLAGQQADVLNVLEMVRDNGLLTTAESVCERLSPPGTPAVTDVPPTRVFIVTCDRPPAVQRLLESMLHAGNLTRHEHLFLVDDSRDPQNAVQNREAVARFNLTSARDMHYVGADEQKRLMAALIKALPEDEQGIRFLIDREHYADKKSYGLARTLCLLLSVGNRAIVMDDDVICAAVESPHKREGLAFKAMAQEVDFYSSEQDIVNRTARAEFDPLTGHASCLGLSMAQAIRKLGFDKLEAQDLAGANAAYLNQWDADSPILMTQSGTLGDPGTVGTQWIYTLGPDSLHRALQAPGGLEAALTNRHYWMGQPRPLFSKMAVISQVTGLDNSKLLPPYLPVFRGEDYLFGAMTEYLHPQAATLDYPWSVPHFPLELRAGNPNPQPPSGKGNINFSKYVTDRTLYQSGIRAETRLSRLAVTLRELAETPDRGLLSIYRSEIAEGQSAQVQRLSARLQNANPGHELWQAWLQQGIANLNGAMQTVASPLNTPGLPGSYDEQAICAEFRDYANGFANALQNWASLRGAARSATDEMLATGELKP